MLYKQNFTTNQINKSSQKYSHLSEDSQRFLEYCDKHNIPKIQKHIGTKPHFETHPFSNGDPYPDFFCVRLLASYSNRDILANWSLYQFKDRGFLVRVNDFGKPAPYFYHLKFDNMREIERESLTPVDLILDAKKALENFKETEIDMSSKGARSKQPMIGIPQSTQETPIVTIRPKAKKAKLKTEDELKKLSDMLLNADRHIPTTKDNYWVSVGSW